MLRKRHLVIKPKTSQLGLPEYTNDLMDQGNKKVKNFEIHRRVTHTSHFFYYAFFNHIILYDRFFCNFFFRNHFLYAQKKNLSTLCGNTQFTERNLKRLKPDKPYIRNPARTGQNHIGLDYTGIENIFLDVLVPTASRAILTNQNV